MRKWHFAHARIVAAPHSTVRTTNRHFELSRSRATVFINFELSFFLRGCARSTMIELMLGNYYVAKVVLVEGQDLHRNGIYPGGSTTIQHTFRSRGVYPVAVLILKLVRSVPC